MTEYPVVRSVILVKSTGITEIPSGDSASEVSDLLMEVLCEQVIDVIPTDEPHRSFRD